MKPAMYLFVNSSLEMTAGKIAAQVSHAAVRAFVGTPESELKNYWQNFTEAKIVLDGISDDSMIKIQDYLTEKGFKVFLIRDEGLTEVAPCSITALGVEIVDRELQEVQDCFGFFKLYRPKVKVTVEVER